MTEEENWFYMTEEEYWSDYHIVSMMCHNRVWTKSDKELIDMFLHPLDNLYID